MDTPCNGLVGKYIVNFFKANSMMKNRLASQQHKTHCKKCNAYESPQQAHLHLQHCVSGGLIVLFDSDALLGHGSLRFVIIFRVTVYVFLKM